MKVVLDGILEKLSTLNDGSVKLSICTQEMDATNGAQIFGLRGKYLKVLLSDTNITEPEAILIDEAKVKDGRKIKTHSQRLRAVLFRLHEQTAPDTDFEQFYNEKMEGLIEHYKQKLQ